MRTSFGFLALVLLLSACEFFSANRPPVISGFSASPPSGSAPLSVSFSWTASDPDGDALACALSPGDGTPAYPGCAPRSHTYAVPGTYTARLTVSDGRGGQVERSLSVQVKPPSDFTLSLNPTSLTVQKGGSGTTQLTLTPQNGFTGNVTLALEDQNGNPAPGGIALSPTTVTVSGSNPVTQTLTLSVGSSVAPGSYALRVKAQSGSLSRTASLALTVTGPQSSDFTLTLESSQLTVSPGGIVYVRLVLNGTYTGQVALSLVDANRNPFSQVTLSPTSAPVPSAPMLELAASSSLAPGTYSLYVRGTGGSLVREAPLTLTVSSPPAPDFGLALDPTSLAVVQGGSGQVTLTLTPQNGFAGTVSLSLVNPPSGVSLSPTSVSVPGSGPVQQALTISTTGSTPTGTHTLTIKATSGSLERTATLSLTVNPPPSFDLSLNPTSLTVQQGQSGGTTLTLTPQNGFAGTVNLTLENQDGTPAPSGITLTPTSVAVSGSSPATQTLTLGVNAGVAPGTYALRVKATSGSLVRTVNLTLTVTAPPPDFTLSLNPTSLTVQQGSSGTTQLTLTPQNGFTGAVNLTLERGDGTPAPSGITLTPTSVSVTSSTPVTQTLTLSVASSAATGTYNLRIKATSGSLTRTAGFTLTVTAPPPPPSFTLSLNPTSLTVPQGGSGTTQLTLTPQNGFTGTVNLSLLDRSTSTPVDGITLSPTALTVSGSGAVTQTLTVGVASSVAPGSYALKVRAQGGSVVREANLDLTVQAGGSLPDLYIAKAEWGQTVVKENLRLVEGKEALLRVYLLADRSGVSGALSGAVYQGSTFRGNLSFTCPSPLPTSVDPSSLSYSCNATVSASWVAPGLRVVLTADPNNQIAEANENNNTLTLTPQVGAGTVLYLTAVPVIHQGTQAQVPPFAEVVRKIWPLKEVSYTTRAPYTTQVILSSNDGNTWGQLLTELRTLRQTDGSNRYYYGFVRVNYTSGIAGIGYVGYPVAVGWDYTNSAPAVMAHELGHNFGRQHTPCGVTGDPNYPYPNGSIGTWGYDLTKGELKDPSQYKDLMSYCSPLWISDYTYEGAQSFLEATPPKPQSLSLGEYVLLSGRIEGDLVRLYPPVYYTGYPAEVKPGEYRLEADTEKGPVTLSFAPMQDSEGGLSFQVSLPAAPRSLRVYRGSALLLERQATLAPQALPEAELKEEGGKAVLTWRGAPYASLVHVAPEGVRTTLGLWHTGGRSEFSTEGLPPGGWFEVQLSDGVSLEVRRFPR